MPSHTKLASTPPPTIGYTFMSRKPLEEARNNVDSFLKPQKFQYPLEEPQFLQLKKDFKLLINSDPTAREKLKEQLLEKSRFALKGRSPDLMHQVIDLFKDNFPEVSQGTQKITITSSLQK